MKSLNKLVLLSILIILLSICAVSATDNIDNQTLDDTNEEIIDSGEFKTIDEIQTQINLTEEGQTLEIDGIYECYGNELKIDKSMTIDGSDDAEIVSAKANISSGDVVLKNLVLDWTKIFATNSKLTLINCTIKNSVSNYDYAIDFKGETLEIINSTFNTGNPFGSAKNLVVINSMFNGNNYYGHLYDITSAQIINSKFINYTELYFIPYEAVITNCSFVQNVDMYLSIKNANITGCEFINNTDLYLKNRYNSNCMIKLTGNSTLSYNTFLNNGYVVGVAFNPDKNVVSNFKMTDNIFISQTCNYSYYLDYNEYYPLMFTAVFINPSVRTIHVIDEVFDDYLYDEIISKIYLKNNFFGFNIEEVDEYYLNNIITLRSKDKLKTNIVTLNLEKGNGNYTLRFVDDNNTVDLPKSVYSIVDKVTGEIFVSNITVENGKATFLSDKEISQDEVYIINCLNQIVNKPKVNITLLKTGNDYFDTTVEAILINGSEPIGNESIKVIVTQYFINGGNFTFSYNVLTRANGTQTLDGRYNDNGTYLYGPFIDDGTVERYDIKVVFSNREFGTSTQSISFEMDKVDTILTLESSTKTYDPTAYRTTSMSQLSPVKWASTKYGKIVWGQLYYRVYKNKKLVFETILNFYNGVIKPHGVLFPVLNVGTYKVEVCDVEDSPYNVPTKFSTLKINPAKTTIKASKVTNKYKKSKYFKISVKSKGKFVRKVNVNLKIYTGKKYKNYVVKTDNFGIAKFNTKNLKIGKHKVVISSKNANYAISGKSQITIKK